MWYDVPGNCGTVHGPYEYNNYSQTSNAGYTGSYFRSNAHNKTNPEHCINYHIHYIWWWNGSSWVYANQGRTTWTYGDWTYNPETFYWSNKNWTVTKGYSWTSTSYSYMNSNRFAGNVGLGGHWDDESALSPQCWKYNGGSSWTRTC